MGLINEEGTYRGQVVNGGVSTTKNGYPQLVLELNATEVYDAELATWVEGLNESLTAYLCLFGGSGDATLAVDQVIEVTGWDGASFGGLNALVEKLIANGGLPIQFDVQESTYNDQTRLQVAWIRPYDAPPGRAVRKCTQDELTALDKKYAHGLQKIRVNSKATVKKAAPPKPPAPPEPLKAKANPKNETAPPSTKAKGRSSKGKAWNELVKTNKGEHGAEFTDDVLAETWQTVIAEVVGDTPDDSITSEQWFQIQQACKDRVTIPF